MKNIALLGYYGYGNFGDDVLLHTTYNLVRHLWPEAEIGIRLPPGASYVKTFLDGPYKEIEFGENSRWDLIIHGGGGNYFDFVAPSVSELSIGAALRLIPLRVRVRLERLIRNAVGKQGVIGGRRIGLGIGIGNYVKGSWRLIRSSHELSDYRHIWVRDRGSLDNLRSLGFDTPATEGSDLAFLTEYWLPPRSAPRATEDGRLSVAVMLRDWPFGDRSGSGEQFHEIIEELASEFDVHIFLLDPRNDRETAKACGMYSITSWEPGRMTLSGFLQQVANMDVVLTSRAHGAICGACLGLGSVILDIEPKLRRVAEMLPNSSALLSPAASSTEIKEALKGIALVPRQEIEKEVQANRLASKDALEHMLKVALGVT